MYANFTEHQICSWSNQQAVLLFREVKQSAVTTCINSHHVVTVVFEEANLKEERESSPSKSRLFHFNTHDGKSPKSLISHVLQQKTFLSSMKTKTSGQTKPP